MAVPTVVILWSKQRWSTDWVPVVCRTADELARALEAYQASDQQYIATQPVTLSMTARVVPSGHVPDILAADICTAVLKGEKTPLETLEASNEPAF